MTDNTINHPLDKAVQLDREDDFLTHGQFPKAYSNMVGPYGGIIAAILLNAVLGHPERQGDPVAITVNFAGPLAESDYSVAIKVARTNRSTQHWSLELLQGDGVVATATVFLAIRRDSWSGADITMPTVPPADALAPLDTSGLMRWVQNYELRTIEGAFDFSGESSEQEDALTRLWVRDNPPRPLDFVSLLAISDCFFPRIFVRRQQRIPAGTVSMTTYFHADTELLAAQGDRPLLAEARGGRYYRNYFNQTGELWGDDGTLLANTQQIVYFKG